MLISLSGYAQSGKDTVGNYLVQKYDFTRFAFADALKEFAYTLNPIIEIVGLELIRLQKIVDAVTWDIAKKHDEIRRILQVLGTECGRDILGPGIWIDVINRKYQESEGNVVITDCRFKNEVLWSKDRGQLWWIDRQGVAPLNEHASENTISHRDADHILFNNQDLTNLYKQIDMLMERGVNA